jgi:hypothetical protein
MAVEPERWEVRYKWNNGIVREFAENRNDFIELARSRWKMIRDANPHAQFLGTWREWTDKDGVRQSVPVRISIFKGMVSIDYPHHHPIRGNKKR